ncbi:hypothetical protein LC55x_2784 [Lysobacter capsici]|nr:hypothetical protein LC55x_2784 [Lysobacter capsici]
MVQWKGRQPAPAPIAALDHEDPLTITAEAPSRGRFVPTPMLADQLCADVAASAP